MSFLLCWSSIYCLYQFYLVLFGLLLRLVTTLRRIKLMGAVIPNVTQSEAQAHLLTIHWKSCNDRVQFHCLSGGVCSELTLWHLYQIYCLHQNRIWGRTGVILPSLVGSCGTHLSDFPVVMSGGNAWQMCWWLWGFCGLPSRLSESRL